MSDNRSMLTVYIISVIMGALIISSTFIDTVVVEEIARTNAPFRGYVERFPEFGMLRYAIIAWVILELALIWLIRKGLLSRRLTAFLKRNKASLGKPGAIDYMQYLMAHFIIFVLCLSVSMYGLILFLMAGSRADYYLFTAMSLAAFALYFPRYGKLRAWAVAMAGEAPAGKA